MDEPAAPRGLPRRKVSDDDNPVFHSYLRAFMIVLDSGRPVSQANISKELGFKYAQSLNKLHRRNPTLRSWTAERLKAILPHEGQTVRMKMAQLAGNGSVKAAEVLRRFEEMALPRQGGRYDEMGQPAQGVSGFQVNILVPRPPDAALPEGFGDGPIRVSASVLDQVADMGAPPPLPSNSPPPKTVPGEVSSSDDPLVAVLGPKTSNGR